MLIDIRKLMFNFKEVEFVISGCEDIDNGVISSASIYAGELVSRYGGQEGWWHDTKLSIRKAIDQPLRGIPIISGQLELVNQKVRPIAESVLGDLVDKLSSHPDSAVKSQAKSLRKSINSENFDLNIFNKDSVTLIKALGGYANKLIDKSKNKEITPEIKQAIKEVSSINSKFNTFGRRASTAIDKLWAGKKK